MVPFSSVFQMPRSEVVKRMWVYFKEHKLLVEFVRRLEGGVTLVSLMKDPHNRQYINCDDTLAKLFGRFERKRAEHEA